MQQRKKARGGNNYKSTVNRYLKPYKTIRSNPFFTYYDVKALAYDSRLVDNERESFKRFLPTLQKYIRHKSLDPGKPCAFVNVSGELMAWVHQEWDRSKYLISYRERRLKKPASNKYLRVYNSPEEAPDFTYYEIEYLMNDQALCLKERHSFERVYEGLQDFIKYKTLDPSKPCAFVYYGNGKLHILMDQDGWGDTSNNSTTEIAEKEIPKVKCLNEEFIPYDDVCWVAFDRNTDEEIALKFQAALIKAKKMSNKWKADLKRFRYYLRPDTGDIRVYFD